MNEQRINQLINYLRTNFCEVGFNMESFAPVGDLVDYSGHNCGTSCCLAGHVLIQAGISTSSFLIDSVAAEYLGLSEIQSTRLFTPVSLKNLDPYSATPEQAIKVLEHLLATGEVDWGVMAI